MQNVATGQYLNNARVTVRGTGLVAFTDQSGTFQLAGVPAGQVVVEVFYTDLDPQTFAVELSPDQRVEQNVSLTSVARYGDVVQLDQFVVNSDRETDEQAIATNEQRFAPNIKNVMSTDALGDVMSSCVGEFLKFIPGVTANYDNASITGISVRGIGGAMTSFTSDGSPIVSSGISAVTSRAFDTNTMALNDISRIEVTKVPTPSRPADSLAGSVNVVSKSAFERSRAQLRYGVTLLGNSENVTLHKTPRAYDDRRTAKLLPGFDLDYTLPIGKNFGLVLTALRTARFNEQHISQMTWSTAGTSTGATIARPYLQTHLLADDPRNELRKTISLKADWRVTRHGVISVSSQWSELENIIGNDRLTTNAGNNGTPATAGGVPLTFGGDFTEGAAGRGSVTLSAFSHRYEQSTAVSKASYRFDNGRWKVDAAASRSSARTVRRHAEHGHFYELSATLRTPVRISFRNITPDAPGAVQAFDAANRPVDLTDIGNYQLTTATDVPLRKQARFTSGNLDLRRRLEAFPVPASIQIGGFRGVQTLDVSSYTRTWGYDGPDGVRATPDSPAPYRMQTYVNQDAGYGFGRDLPWLSSMRAWGAFQENPILFSQAAAQQVTEETLRITNSEFVRETVTAAYVQAEASFWRDRLKVLTGVRYEKTEDDGLGMLFDPNAVFVRTASGGFAHTATGARIRKPEAGAAGSMQEVRLTRQERGFRGTRTYDGYYPSLHTTFDVRENLLARVAYAKTYGRPNFSDIIPNATFNENDLTEAQQADPSVIKGTITLRNTALRPWTADNYDLSLEYYTKQGGSFSAGIFLKEIDDFFGTSVKLATEADLEELGLDPRYVGWNINTKFNAGDARITGVEFNVRHSLRALGAWGGAFTVFANGTKLRLEGNQQSSFASFVPTTANWGASFSRKRVTLVARWNHRGLDKNTAVPAFGADAFSYIEARTTLDLSFNVQLTRRLTFSASANNVFNEPQVALRYGSETPAYARQFNTREFGVVFALGVKGTF